MQDNKYTLRYIPRFEKDLIGIVDYIVFTLHNPDSAMNLIDKIEKAILERLNYPLSFEPFQSNKKRGKPYYRIYVDNFTVFYVVIDNVMEVRRVLYKSRDVDKFVK